MKCHMKLPLYLELNKNQEIKKKISDSYSYLKRCELFRRTPTLDMTENFRELGFNNGIKYFLKNETLQGTGSFKIRGALNQIRPLRPQSSEESPSFETKKFVTFSAGNYGKSFATMCKQHGFDGVVVMPDFSPIERSQLIESLGVKAIRCDNDSINSILDNLVEKEARILLHPYDDWDLIHGNASFGLEMLEDVTKIDVAIVCCGGGAILAGTALALRLFSEHTCKVYGVEPETADTMRMSFIEKKPVTKSGLKSIASGLSPPNAGKITYSICEEFVDAIVTVTDDQIIAAMQRLHQWGIKAEPSGSAATAAVLFDKIDCLRSPGLTSLNVVVAVTGGNCSTDDLRLINCSK